MAREPRDDVPSPLSPLLEPAALEAGSPELYMTLVTSQAISLKRIADALEAHNKSPAASEPSE